MYEQQQELEVPHQKSCFTKLNRFLCKRQTLFYVNNHPIDEYIDNYFLVYCPSSYSVYTTNKRVYQLLHEIIVGGQEDQINDDVGEYFKFRSGNDSGFR